MKLALWGESWAASLAGREDDIAYNLAVTLDTLKFSSEPVQVFRQCEAIVKSANIRFITGAHDGLLAPASFASNAEAVDYFCTVLQFLCETAGAYNTDSSDFRGGLFNEITSGFLKQPGHPPLILLLLAEYLGASKYDGFVTAPKEFNKMREVFSSIGEHKYFLSDEWKLADKLSDTSTQTPSTIDSDLDLAMQLCRSDDLSSSDAWKAFTLFLASNVARKSSNALETQEDLWLRLESDVPIQSGRLPETLANVLTRAGNGGLTMNETAASVIETITRIDSSCSHDVLASIMPLVNHTTPSEIDRLRSWITKNWQPKVPDEIATLLSRHAALLMAEHNLAFEPAWIRPVLDLALHGDDRSKARAVLVLGGPITQVQRGTRRRVASSMGFNSMNEMAACYFHECLATGNDQKLGLGFNDVHFDHCEVAS